MPSLSLSEVKVIDFTMSGVGPLVTKALANHGAKVIKIESGSHPDSTRTHSPFRDNIPGLDRSGVFVTLNSGKYSMTVDLNNARGIEVIRKLVRWADVAVESFAAGSMDKRGLGYANFRKIRPDIIMVSLSSQGQTGPYATHPAWGFNLKGLAGFAHLTGWADRGPAPESVPLTDMIAPWFGFVAVMSALLYRRRTGKGQFIDLSQCEASLHFLSPALLDYTVNGRIQMRKGNQCDRAAPHGVYPCKGSDRWCAMAVFSEEEWRRLCRAMGDEVWTKDPRFASLTERKANEDELNALIAGWTVNFTAEEVMTRMQGAGIPSGAVQDCQVLMEEDPQLRHRGYFQRLNYPEIGPCYHQAWPFRLSKTPAQLRPMPRFGQDNEFICTQLLGMTDQEFAELLNAGAFE